MRGREKFNTANEVWNVSQGAVKGRNKTAVYLLPVSPTPQA